MYDHDADHKPSAYHRHRTIQTSELSLQEETRSDAVIVPLVTRCNVIDTIVYPDWEVRCAVRVGKLFIIGCYLAESTNLSAKTFEINEEKRQEVDENHLLFAYMTAPP